MSRRFARAQAGRSLGRDARPSRMKVKGPQTIPSGGYSMRRLKFATVVVLRSNVIAR